jgi:hypothetical protein
MDTDKLKALALAATPGAWHAPGMGEIHAENHEEIAHISYHTGYEDDMQCGTDADADYIAAACPATVLALIAEVEDVDRLLRASVPDRWKDCASPVGAVQSYIAELEAEVDRLRARFEYIEDNATTVGGGHGFTVTLVVPVDHEDIGCGIDAAIEKEKA